MVIICISDFNTRYRVNSVWAGVMSSFSLDGCRSKKRKLQDDDSTSSADEGYGPSPWKKFKASEKVSQPCYYGWFLEEKEQNRKFLKNAKAWFKACRAKDEKFRTEFDSNYPYGRRMMSKESKWQVHCTARYVGDKKKKEKKPNENERKMLLQKSEIKVVGNTYFYFQYITYLE